jgi:hypothetical protein
MECFAHSAVPAVGTCKSCSKGVCRSCAIQVERGLACSEQCRPFAESLSLVQKTSIRNLNVQSAQRFVLPLISVLFLGMGLYLLANGNYGAFAWFYIVAGASIGLAMLISRQKRAVRK